MQFTLENGDKIFLKLLKGVKDLPNIRKRVISGEISCGLIKPSLIVDPFQIVVAANKASVSAQFSKMTTKNIYTEILFNLSTSKNITQSLIKFGVNDSDKELILVVVGSEEDLKKAETQVSGDELDLSQLSTLTNTKEVMKVYNIQEAESLLTPLRDSVVTRIAVKQCMI